MVVKAVAGKGEEDMDREGNMVLGLDRPRFG